MVSGDRTGENKPREAVAAAETLKQWQQPVVQESRNKELDYKRFTRFSSKEISAYVSTLAWSADRDL